MLALPSDCRAAEKIGFHRSLALHLDGAAFFKPVTIAEEFVRRRCYLGSAWLALRFHAACCVHRISPKIVNEFVLANDAGYHRPRADSDPQLQKDLVLAAEFFDGFMHIEGHSSCR